MQEEEASPMEAPYAVHRVDEADAPYLDLEEDWEIQAYNHIKGCVFVHTPLYDPNLLGKIGMDTKFTSIFKAIGWENVDPMDEQGSRHLTIQFLCMLLETKEGITFCLFGKDYEVTWKDLSLFLGFHRRCSIKTDHTL
jgi:hypothetical protein